MRDDGPHSAYQFYQTHRLFDYGYYSMLQWWAEAFGSDNLIVRPYESSQWPQQNIINDFCQAVGIRALKGANVEHNDSLGGMQLYMKRCLNRVGYSPEVNESVIKLLRRIVTEPSVTSCRYINAKVYSRYRDQWLDDNERISQTYLGGRPLFTQAIPGAAALPYYKVDRDDATRCVALVHEAFSKGRYRELRQLFSQAVLLCMAELNLWSDVDASARAALLNWATESE